MISKMHTGLSMGDLMVIKTDEIKAEMVNYNKTKYDNTARVFYEKTRQKKAIAR